MTLREQFGNNARSQLQSGIDASQTTISISPTDVSLFPTTGQFRIQIDNEYMLVTAGGGTSTFTVTRGVENTTKATHNSGASVSHVITAGGLNSIIQSNVQGLYARSAPVPDSGGVIYPYAIDPIYGSGARLWAWGATSHQIGYTDDHGATFHPMSGTLPWASNYSVVQIIMTSTTSTGVNYMFVMTADQSITRGGQIWRSPAPAADGSGLTFTKIQDLSGLSLGPGGAVNSGPSNSSFRNQDMDFQTVGGVDYLYSLTYGATSNISTNLGGSASYQADGFMAAGSDIFYSANGNGLFIGCLVGTLFTVAGAGAAGANLVSTVVRVFGNKKIQLSDCAQTSVTSAKYGTGSITGATDPSAGASQTYGAQNCVGGPFFYISVNPTAASAASVAFTMGKQFTYARHGHAVKCIGGVPWVSNGDYPFPQDQIGQPPTSYVGLWAAQNANPSSSQWNALQIPSYDHPYDCVNFFPIAINGINMIVGEPDNKFATGPLFYPTQSITPTGAAFVPSSYTRVPVVGTARCLCITPEGNIIMLVTGESGAVGPVDCIMMWTINDNYATPIILEQQLAPGSGTAYGSIFNAIVDGPYVWMGSNRVTREKCVNQ